MKQIKDLGVLTMCVFVFFIVAGGSPKENIVHTALAAIYVSTLSLSTIHNVTNDGEEIQASIMQRITFQNFMDDNKFSRRCRIQSDDMFPYMVSCIVPFQLLLLLDRGFQIQRWPIAIILGSSSAWMLSTILSVFRVFSKETADLQKSVSSIRH
jgi:hypothetical protein